MSSYESVSLAAAILAGSKSRKPQSSCVQSVNGKRCGAKLRSGDARYCNRHASLSHG